MNMMTELNGGLAFESMDEKLLPRSVVPNYSTGVAVRKAATQEVISSSTFTGYALAAQDTMYVMTGGVANATTAVRFANINVSSNGIANSTVLNGGGMIVSHGGIASNTVVNSGGMTVQAGGSANGATIASTGAITMESGAKAGYVKIANYGTFSATSGATVTGIEAAQGAILSFDVASNTVVSGTYNSVSFSMKNALLSNWVLRGSSAPDSSATPETYMAYMTVHGGATVKTTTVAEYGAMTVLSGGTAEKMTVEAGGSLTVEAGGILKGLSVAAANGVRMDQDSVLNFTISAAEPGTEALVNNLSYITGTPDYTITVSTTQANGEYMLAGGAANFTGSMSVVDTTGKTLGSLSVGGSIVNGDITYKLLKSEADLYMTVTSTLDGKASCDLDANGFSDTILVHDAGFCGTWLTTGESDVIKWSDLSTVNPGWSVFGTGKAFGVATEESDVFVTDGTTLGIWTIANGEVTAWKGVGSFDPASTTMLGLGDFNGDGASDVLLRSKDGGDLGAFFSNDSQFHYFKGLGPEWTIAGIGDLDGNGYDDVIIRHDMGYCGAYMMSDNGNGITWMDLDMVDSSLQMIGTGDMNGDGNEDVIIRKGEWVGAWIIDGGVKEAWGLTTLDTSTDIEQIADYNADGIADLRIRTEGGDVGALLVSGAESTEFQYFQGLGDEWTTKFAAPLC